MTAQQSEENMFFPREENNFPDLFLRLPKIRPQHPLKLKQLKLLARSECACGLFSLATDNSCLGSAQKVKIHRKN